MSGPADDRLSWYHNRPYWSHNRRVDTDRDTQTVNTSIRLPARLHERLRREAERQDRTVHNLMLHYLRRGLDEDLYRDVDPFERARLMKAREDEDRDEDR